MTPTRAAAATAATIITVWWLGTTRQLVVLGCLIVVAGALALSAGEPEAAA